MHYFISVVFPIILTATVTAYVTHIFANRRDRKKEDREFKNDRKKFAIALSAEIKACMSIYNNEEYKLSKELPKDGSEIKIGRIECNYVVTFDNNTDKLGLLDEKDIPQVISFYTRLKSLLDTLMVLATGWERYSEFCNTLKTQVSNEVVKRPNDDFSEILTSEFITREQLLKEYVDGIYKFAYDLQEKILKDADNIIQLLEKYNPDKENDTK